MSTMQKLLAISVLYQHNYRVLHWKVCSTDFDPVHALMDSYVSEFGEFIDKFAEMSMMIGMNPIAIHEIDSVLSSMTARAMSISSDKNYTPKEVFELSGRMLTTLQEMVREELTNESLPRGIQSELEVIDYWITKELNYKNKQRLS